MSTEKILLYSRDDCELCDHALAMLDEELNKLSASGSQTKWRVLKVDIAKDPALSEKFGWHIPVLERSDSNALLYWPFPPSRLRAFLLV